MDPRILHHRKQVMSRCALGEARPGRPLSTGAASTDAFNSRFSNVVARLEGKRRQMVERLVERTMVAYGGCFAEGAPEKRAPILD